MFSSFIDGLCWFIDTFTAGLTAEWFGSVIEAVTFVAVIYLVNFIIVFLVTTKNRKDSGLTDFGDNSLHERGFTGYTSSQARNYLAELCRVETESDNCKGKIQHNGNVKVQTLRLEIYSRAVNAMGLASTVYALVLAAITLDGANRDTPVPTIIFVVGVIILYLISCFVESAKLQKAASCYKHALDDTSTLLSEKWEVGLIGSADDIARQFHRAVTMASMMTVCKYWTFLFLLMFSVLVSLS